MEPAEHASLAMPGTPAHSVIELQPFCNTSSRVPVRTENYESLRSFLKSTDGRESAMVGASIATANGAEPQRWSLNANHTTFCIGATMCVVVLTVVTMTAVIYARVEYLIDQSAAKVLPLLDAGLDDVASVLENSATMSRHVSKMTQQGDVLLTTSVPKLISMLNQTQRVMGLFERFSSHPSINIGMGYR